MNLNWHHLGYLQSIKKGNDYALILWDIFTDIDECTVDDTICGPGGSCTNTVGSHECSCDDGYEGGGTATPCSGMCLVCIPLRKWLCAHIINIKRAIKNN